MKLILSFSAALLLLLSGNLFSQVTTQWSSVYNGSASDTDIVTAMTVDLQGNVYVTGYSKGSGTGKDIATIKYSTSGEQIWATRFNNEDAGKDDAAYAIAVDGLGNVYVTGYTTGLKSFKDYVTLKYSSSGSILWSSVYNGKGNDDDVSSAIAIDGLGNIFITGSSVGALTSEDFLTIKYSSAGTELWTVAYNNFEMDDIDIATSLALDNSGSVFITGYSIGTGTAEDYATIKYNTSGQEQWVRRYNGDGNDYDITTSIAIDATGNVCVTGYSFGDGTSEDYATVKYDGQGNLLWEKRYDSSGQYDIATSVTADLQGNIYVTGYSYDKATSEDYATIKYSVNGDEQWVSRYNGASGESDIASSVKTDNNGGVYVTGNSYAFNEEENYVTIKYNSDGDQIWEDIYNGAENGSDIASSIFTDASGNVYVSGYSYDGTSSVDYVTQKYTQTVGINSASSMIPGSFELKQNYPNPFNPNTVIRYSLDTKMFVSLSIYNSLGTEIAHLVNENQTPGNYEINFDGNNIPSGTYFYRLQSGNNSQTMKMLLLK